MALIKPPVLPPWADAGDKVQPSNAEIQLGWPLSSVPPSRQRFNWILNYLANAVRYFSRRGIPDYDAAEIYMIGDRTLAPNGKTYKCKVDNTTNVEPSTDAAKWELWGFSKSELSEAGLFVTPPQFDVTTKVATMEALARAAGNIAGEYGIAGSMALTAAHAGKNGYISGAGGYVLSLPDPATFIAGTTFHFFNASSAAVTVSATAGKVLSPGGVGSMSLAASNTATFYWNGASWLLFAGTESLKNAGVFSSSKAGSGWQKLPSGLIIQWGQTGTTANSTTSVGLPIAFPTVFAQILVTPRDNVASPPSAGQYAFGAAVPTSLSAFDLRNYYTQSGLTFGYMAIGY